MALVVILAVAWLVLLGPGLVKRWFDLDGQGDSITHFHRQLRVLEHSGGVPLVRPAYRLRSIEDDGPMAGPGGPATSLPVLTVVGADQLPRPALAFLGDDPRDRAAPAGDGVGAYPGRPAAPAPDTHPMYRAADPWARQVARQRRRDTLAVLALVFTCSLLVGFIPGAHVLWVVTALAGVALGTYVALLVRLRSLAEERDRKLRYLPSSPGPAYGMARAEAADRDRHPAGRAVGAH